MNGKLKAGTIMESTVAMVLIMVCLGIGTMVITNVLTNDSDYNTYKAKCILNDISSEIKKSQIYIDGNETVQPFIIQKRFEKYPESENLLHITLRVVDENEKVIYERHELVLIK